MHIRQWNCIWTIKEWAGRRIGTLPFKCLNIGLNIGLDIEQKRTKERDISKRKFDISKYLFIILLIEQFIYGKIVTMRSRIGEIYDKSYIDGD